MMMFAAKTCAINTTPLWHNAHKRLNYLVVNSCQQSQVVVELLSRANWQQFLDGIWWPYSTWQVEWETADLLHVVTLGALIMI